MSRTTSSSLAAILVSLVAATAHADEPAPLAHGDVLLSVGGAFLRDSMTRGGSVRAIADYLVADHLAIGFGAGVFAGSTDGQFKGHGYEVMARVSAPFHLSPRIALVPSAFLSASSSHSESSDLAGVGATYPVDSRVQHLGVSLGVVALLSERVFLRTELGLVGVERFSAGGESSYMIRGDINRSCGLFLGLRL